MEDATRSDRATTIWALGLACALGVSALIVQSALARHESRGLHYTLDFPETDESQEPRDTVLVP